MNLYLVRHGQSYVNLPDYDKSNLDAPLTPLGEKQAELAAQWIAKHLPAQYIFASDMARARQTAEAISRATGLSIQFDIRLREVGTNRADGTPLPATELKAFIETLWGSLQPYDLITANSESWMQFRNRVGTFIEELKRSYGPGSITKNGDYMPPHILLICHGGVIEAFYEYIFQKGPWSVITVMTNNTGITYFQFLPRPSRPDWRLFFHNKLDHLTPELMSY